MSEKYLVDSAGTGGWHIGELADARMRKHALKRGYDLQSRARQVKSSDFQDFDLILAMDKSNLHNLHKMTDSEEAKAKCYLMTDFCYKFRGVSEVPDPYYGGESGFERVLDLLEDACSNLIDKIELGEV